MPDAPQAELLTGARDALARRDARRALALLAEAERLAPLGVAGEALLGVAYFQADQAIPAAEHLERALAAGARDPLVLLQLGLAYRQLRRPADAERVFRQALSATDSDAARLELGRVLLWEGRAGEAVPYLRAAAAAQPEDVDRALDLGTALEAAGSTTEALGVFRAAAARAPDLPRARYGLARALRREGETAEAASELAAYERLQQARRERTAQEGRARARLDGGWELLRTGHPRQALAVFAAETETVEGLCGIAFASSALGDHAAAVAALAKAVELAPDRSDLRAALAEERRAAEATP